jgi:molecular chaperone HscB
MSATPDYFVFMGLPVAFKIDEAALRKRYYANSRDFHPDRFSLEDEAKVEWAEAQSALNNTAFATLSDADKRLEYVLRLKGVLTTHPGQNEVLPQDFLMEMMDINEGIMDLQMDFDESRLAQIVAQVDTFERELQTGVQNVLDHYTEATGTEADLMAAKNFYLKRKYLLRIRENLSTFASA